MKQKLQKVRPEDLKQLDLENLAAEGKLFMVVEDATQATDDEILEYVSRVAHCAAPEYATTITDIWEFIVGSPLFQLRYVKGPKQGNICKPKIMAIMEVLYNKGVYDSHASKLFQILENTDKKANTFNDYTAMSKDSYCVKKDQCKAIFQFLEENRTFFDF